MRGDPRFHDLLEKIGILHDKKQEDYGTDGDPFANVRSASEFGLAPDLGVAIRMNDKMQRIKKFYKSGGLANDSVEDDYMDIAVYALIALVLRDERSEAA